jgi:hypothetical protein
MQVSCPFVDETCSDNQEFQTLHEMLHVVALKMCQTTRFYTAVRT